MCIRIVLLVSYTFLYAFIIISPQSLLIYYRSNNFYFALLLTMLFLCVLPVGYAIVWVEPSWHCGPFSGYSKIYNLATQSLISPLPKLIQRYASVLLIVAFDFAMQIYLDYFLPIAVKITMHPKYTE